jgi:hypothetical protein
MGGLTMEKIYPGGMKREALNIMSQYWKTIDYEERPVETMTEEDAQFIGIGVPIISSQ